MARPSYYVLDDNCEPVPESSASRWRRWCLENIARRSVGYERVGDADVSTVFLGIDQSPIPDGRPILWETLVFGGGPEFDQYQQMYASQRDAMIGHFHAVQCAKRRWQEIRQLDELIQFNG